MSVIVNGMEYPYSCSECNLCLDNYCRQLKKIVGGYGVMNIHHPDCPLRRCKDREWIPVTERLPELGTFVYATCKSLIDDREDWVIDTVYVPLPPESERRYSDWGNIPMLNLKHAEVIAWMEMDIPEPYKENSKKDEED